MRQCLPMSIQGATTWSKSPNEFFDTVSPPACESSETPSFYYGFAISLKQPKTPAGNGALSPSLALGDSSPFIRTVV